MNNSLLTFVTWSLSGIPLFLTFKVESMLKQTDSNYFNILFFLNVNTNNTLS
jgi:hypothetical protein